jgi:two-component system, OmpR family, phosphate regulon sensor histidine kinase PhoR
MNMQAPACILVIDDEEIMREGCSRILSKDGYLVITAENGAQGLGQLISRSDQIHTVLLDLMMPGVNGMDVLNQIRGLDPQLPVIVITGHATVETAVEAMKGGAYDFIAKPFTPDQLRIVVKRALERSALHQEAEFLRKERERSLRDIATEKSKIRTIIQCMGDGVLVCDRDRCVVLSNPAASRLLNRPENSLLGNLLSQCNLDPELSGRIEESLQAKESGFTSVSQELSVGEQIYLRAHTAPVKDDLGEVMGSVTVLQDISPLKQLDHMKSEFIAMVAHELRAPITTLEQQLNVLLSKTAGEMNRKQEEILGRAKERTRGLLGLIKDLLDLSKIEAGKMIQYKEPLVIQDVIERVLELVRPDADAKGIEIAFSPAALRSMIQADRNSMEGVFTNLVSNAIKYTPERGKIGINVGEDGVFVRATVSDTGIGIKKEDLPRIFDRFYRVRSTETRQIVGTGLGLSIVKSVLDAHLASIHVDSEVGKGTTCTVLFPKETNPASCKGDME